MDNKNKDSDNEDEDEFFDAKDYFVVDVEQLKKDNIKKLDTEANSLATEKTTGLLEAIKGTINSVTNRLGGVQPFEDKSKQKVKQMIISIKDKTKSELQFNEEEEDIQQQPEDLKDKAMKLEIITDEAEEHKRTKVTVINKDRIAILSDDIEMSSADSIWFLVVLTVVLIIDMSIICGVSHWIYNYLAGLDWYLERRIHFNFHIFFMTLGICSFGFGLLVHRIFRGWSSCAMNFLHTTITLITLIFFLIGIYAVVTSLNHLDSIHLYSVHSWLGLISILLVAVLWITGIVIFVFPRFAYDMQLLLIPIHSLLGQIVFSIVCSTAIVGFSHKLRISNKDIDNQIELNLRKAIKLESHTQEFWEISAEQLVLNIISIAVFIYLILVTSITTNPKYRRRLLPEEMGIDVKTLKQ